MSFYGNLKATADDLIARYGQTVTMNRETKSGYTPSTGVFTSDSDSTYSAKLVLFNDKKQEKAGNTNQIVTHRAAMSSTTAPKVGDWVEIDSEKLRVQDVTDVNPAGTSVYYELLFTS